MKNIDFGLPNLYGDIAFICTGGAGSSFGYELFLQGYQCLFINSSDQDQSILEEVPDHMKIKLLGTRGNNSNRNKGKEYIKNNYRKIIKDIINRLEGFTHYYIVGSSGGGTNSAFAGTIGKFLKTLIPECTVSFITILPSFNEPYARKINTLEFYEDLKELDLNDFGGIFFIDNNAISANEEMGDFNKKVASTLDFIFNLSTNNKYIDDADLLQMLSTPGCINLGLINNNKLIIDNCFVHSSGNASNIIYDINNTSNIISNEIEDIYGSQDNILYTYREEVTNNIVLFGLNFPTDYFDLLDEYCKEHNNSKKEIDFGKNKRIEIDNVINKTIIKAEDDTKKQKSIDDIFNSLFNK